MRRKTSAWTTTIIGSLLSASIASAQQSAAPNNRSRNPAKAQENDPAATYGASVNRGARYLMRNGLDYLSYQQYERALKFLREAESKQKELNANEKLTLKQGIEHAQRGLREAADAEKPYALSERSTRKGGFRAAKPETAVAAGDHKGSSARSMKRIDPPSADDDKGEPIRLASGETPTPEPDPSTPAASTRNQPRAGRTAARPRSLPEIPNLPSVDAMPKLDHESVATKNPAKNEDQLALAAAEVGEPPAAFDPPKMTSPPAAQAPPATALAPATTPSSISGPAPSSRGMAQPTAAGPAVIELETIPSTAAPAPVQEPAAEPPPAVAPTPTQPAAGPAPATSPPMDNPAPAAEPAMELPALPTEQPAPSLAPAPNPGPSPPATDAAIELPALPADKPAASPAPSPPAAAMEPVPLPAAVVEATPPAASARPEVAQDASAPAEELPLLPQDLGANQAPEPSPAAAAADEALPTLPDPAVQASTPASASIAPAMSAAPTPDAQPAVHETIGDGQTAPAPQPEPVPTTLPALPEAAAAPAPAAPNTPDPPAGSGRATPPTSEFDALIPRHPAAPSTLRPELQREVERIARKQEEMLQRQPPNQPGPVAEPADADGGDLRMQSQIDISRAPSPAEARPIQAIPVPEDWVPLTPRTWSPQSKYWAAAATCHLPLYFQDPVLERYGHSVEQFVGPWGRYLTYPLDDPTQSIQRNQILQPVFSIGLFAMQIIAGPYNLIMDPPWEAQYDLGYYRPGDDVPTDLYWLPLHGYGPPLRGNRY